MNLFSLDTDGLKNLTHDFPGGVDFLEYVYRCQRIILDKRAELSISDNVYSLVRGFVFGPEWIDYKGESHRFFVSSEESVSYFEETGGHPLNCPAFEQEFECFRNSIRFRSGRLDRFFRKELADEFPSLDLMVSASLGDADMYTDTGAIRSAVRLILKSMEEYKDHPRVFISFLEDEVEDGLYKASISITQSGSFPSHPLARDMGRLSEEDGGTFGTIRKKLDGICEWSVCSRWPDRKGADRWRILRDETEAELSPAAIAEGFNHIISIYHKP